MKRRVRCTNGKCYYTKKVFLDECEDCNEMEQIEHDLLKKQVWLGL